MDGTQPNDYRDIEIGLIDPAPSNYRRHLGDLTEMAASMRELGVVQPVLVRHLAGDRFELVAGNRRFGAAKLAGLAFIPCVVRVMSDDDVLEVQIVENTQRADVHPLDEADAFAALVKRGRTPAQIADKIGKPTTYVAQRLQLCQLTKGGRKALDEGQLTIGAAEALARVPAQLQDDALEVLMESVSSDEHAAVSKKHAREVLQEEFMLQLDKAPWDLTDAALVPKAGACSSCPKRTGNRLELFDDVKTKDMCIDPKCHKGKVEAFGKLRLKQAAASGQAVLSGPAGAKALRYGSGFTKVGDSVYAKGKTIEVTQAFLKKNQPPITLAMDERTGGVIELVREADVLKAAKIAAPVSIGTTDDYKARQKKEHAAALKRKRIVALVLDQGVAAAEKSKPDDLMLFIAAGFVRCVWAEVHKAVLDRRGLTPQKKGGASGPDHEAALMKLIDQMKPKELLGLAMEFALGTFAPINHRPAFPEWKGALKALGVNLEKIEKQVAQEEAEKAKVRREREKKAAKKKAPGPEAKEPKAAKTAKPAGAKRKTKAKSTGTTAAAMKGTCMECGCTDESPCGDGSPCVWMDDSETFCSSCAPDDE